MNPCMLLCSSTGDWLDDSLMMTMVNAKGTVFLWESALAKITMMMAMMKMMMMMMVVGNDLSGEKDSPEVYKEDMGGGGGVAGPQDGDDVCDAQQGDDHL